MTGSPVAGFGPFVTEIDVDRAVVTTLRRWLPVWLRQVEREREFAQGTLARPKPGSYANTLSDDEFLDHVLPAVIVTTSTVLNTEITGDGIYLATWKVIVSSVVRGRTPPETRELAALFGGTVRRVLTNHPDLGGFAADVRWVPDGGVAPVTDTTDQGRWLAAGINHFEVDVDNVLSTTDGPRLPDPIYDDPDPDNDPDQTYGTYAPVDNVTVDVGTLERS